MSLYFLGWCFNTFSFIFFRWQARREHDRTMRAGLIPSRQLQERRMLQQRDEMAKKHIREWNGKKDLSFKL